MPQLQQCNTKLWKTAHRGLYILLLILLAYYGWLKLTISYSGSEQPRNGNESNISFNFELKLPTRRLGRDGEEEKRVTSIQIRGSIDSMMVKLILALMFVCIVVNLAPCFVSKQRCRFRPTQCTIREKFTNCAGGRNVDEELTVPQQPEDN